MVRLPPRLGYDSMIPFWNVMACVLSTEFMRGQFTFIPISSHLQLNKRPLVLQSAKLRAGSSFWWWEGNVSHESAYQTQLKSRRMCLNDTGNVNHVERSPHFNFFGPRSMIFAADWGSFTQSQLHGSCCWNRTQAALRRESCVILNVQMSQFLGPVTAVTMADKLPSEGPLSDILSRFGKTLLNKPGFWPI